MQFDWDDANIGHLARPHVDPFEAEDMFYGPVLRSPVYKVEGEARRDLIGVTSAGRILKVVYTVRDSRVRICTAYTAGSQDAEAFKWRFGDG